MKTIGSYLPIPLFLIALSPTPNYSQHAADATITKWLQYSPYVDSYASTKNNELPEFINPCGPGEVRNKNTGSCLPGVSSHNSTIKDINPCGAGASCTPGVGLEGAQELTNPGILRELIQQNGELIK